MKKKGIEYWQLQPTQELLKIKKAIKKALQKNYKLLTNDKILTDINTVLKGRLKHE